MGVIIPGDSKVVHIKRYFALNVFVLMRFYCRYSLTSSTCGVIQILQEANNYFLGWWWVNCCDFTDSIGILEV